MNTPLRDKKKTGDAPLPPFSSANCPLFESLVSLVHGPCLARSLGPRGTVGRAFHKGFSSGLGFPGFDTLGSPTKREDQESEP